LGSSCWLCGKRYLTTLCTILPEPVARNNQSNTATKDGVESSPEFIIQDGLDVVPIVCLLPHEDYDDYGVWVEAAIHCYVRGSSECYVIKHDKFHQPKLHVYRANKLAATTSIEAAKRLYNSADASEDPLHYILTSSTELHDELTMVKVTNNNQFQQYMRSLKLVDERANSERTRSLPQLADGLLWEAYVTKRKGLYRVLNEHGLLYEVHGEPLDGGGFYDADKASQLCYHINASLK
jgi:hypothetical protein